MRPVLIFLLLWLPGLAAAQATISGTVVDSLTRKPLAFASVYLMNTTRGATTDEQGRYILPQVPPGRYELAASYVGYQSRQQAIQVTQAPLTIGLSLLASAQQLGEVVVRPHTKANRPDDYARFLRLFLGVSNAARKCRVRNREAVRLDYDEDEQVLTASAPYKLEVDNPELGYRLTFFDLYFRAEFASEAMLNSIVSKVVFEEMTGSESQQRRWAANRERAYRGSFTHFMRSVYAGQLAEEGFRVQRMWRVPNRRRARADSVLQAHRAAARIRLQPSLPDSIWRVLQQPPVFVHIAQPTLPLDSVRYLAGGRVWLQFRNLLAVTYERAKPEFSLRLEGLLPGQSQYKYQESVLRLLAPAAEVAPGGAPATARSLVTEGYWSFQKMAEALPFDYLPPITPVP